MAKPLDFQSMILALQHYWAEQGCLIWQPYYNQVGAGTMNPATSLRVLGPEAWNVAYVEPSVRPDDGRYGDNPNRLQQHYQFQVILKPDPGNPQELYLKSLQAIGIDPRQHDIRFVEDNWESPALGAWGLGWEVWLDGQEITQFTYFQQSGGLVLNPVSVEITYGLERIAIALQHVRSFRDIQWSPALKYGEINLAAEREHSTYYFEVADVDRLRQMYDLFEKEANEAIEKGLVLPAHDYILKCSHTFNVLDSRGAVGVTERQAFFGRMRALARKTAEAYLTQRETLEYPWVVQTAENATLNTTAAKTAPALAATAPFLLEIGSEELPPADFNDAVSQLKTQMPTLLESLHLDYDAIEVLGTPRRLVVYIPSLATHQPDRAVELKGPPAERAFDAQGNLTKAGEGFARSKGIDPALLKIKEIDGGRYVVADLDEKGQAALDVLTTALPGLIAAIRFNKSMRWNASGVAFSRPLRWFTALLGDAIIPFEYAGYTAGNTTRGLRFRNPEAIPVANAAAYFAAMQAEGIILDPVARKALVLAQVQKLAAAADGTALDDPALLDEVSCLVERPTALLGNFEQQHLELLPPDVLISVMKKHQRYFPVLDEKGNLLPHFIVVRNGDDQFLDIVADGNEQVVRARFADAAFFVKQDLKKPLADFVDGLKTLTFQKALGSMYDKTQRITKLTDALSAPLALTDAEKQTAERTAALAKADLATNMVVEMTSLQGVMGKYYAIAANEPKPVAEAIAEHYLPRSFEDKLPQSKAGLVVGLADRLDSLCGLFAVGMAPSGTKDAFAQRRTAMGLCQNLMHWNIDFDLKWGLQQAAVNLPVQISAEDLQACHDFIVGRLRGMLREQGFRYDVVDAVLAVHGSDPAAALRTVKALSGWVQRDDWNTLLPAFSRCVRITRDKAERFAINPQTLLDPAEKALLGALEKTESALKADTNIENWLTHFIPLVTVINQFFDAVLVMAEEKHVRANRLGLLQRVATLAQNVADFSLLEGF